MYCLVAPLVLAAGPALLHYIFVFATGILTYITALTWCLLLLRSSLLLVQQPSPAPLSVQNNYVLGFFPPGLSQLHCDFLFLVLFGGMKRAVRRDSAVPENILITKKMLNIALNIHLVLSFYQPWR